MKLVLNWRALPLRLGELTMAMEPLELAPVAGSCAASQVLSAWMLLTLTASAGTIELEGSLTLTTTLALQVAPPLPQAVTCRVCEPVDAEICVLRAVPVAMVLLALSRA